MWPIIAQEQGQRDWSTIIDQLARTPLSHVVLFVAICSAVRFAIAPLLKTVPVHKRALGYYTARTANEGLDAIIYAGVFVFLIIRPFLIQAFKIPSESMENILMPGDFIVANKAIYRYTNPKIGDIVVFKPPAWACTADQVDPDTGEVNVDFIKRCQGVPGDVVEVRNGTLYRNGVAIPEPYIKDRMNLDFKLVKYHDQTNDSAWKAWLPDCDQEHKFLAASVKGKNGILFDLVRAETEPERFEYWPLTYTSSGVINEGAAVPFHADANNLKLQDDLKSLPPVKVPAGYYLMFGDNRNNSFDSRMWGLVPREDIIGRSEFIWLPISRWKITRK